MTSDLAAPPAALEVERHAAGAARRRHLFLLVITVVTLLVLGGLIRGWLRPGAPDDTSVEAGFARDMRSHHAQAVTMAMIEFDRSTNPQLRAVAYDIAFGQQREIGVLDGWLQSWELRANSGQPPMTWMAGHSQHQAMKPGELMPGMATSTEVVELSNLTGPALDKRFLELMIRHHRGGVDMARAGLDLSDHRLVDNFAQRAAMNQRAEIDQLQRYLGTSQPSASSGHTGHS